ncbi:MAG: universal stress protein [Meiothermus sp.]|nr:universal stress protein [Meiothermus sp.]
MFKRILIPTDGDDFGQQAMEEGFDLARAAGGEVTLLFALEPPYDRTYVYGPQRLEEMGETLEAMRRQASQKLETFAAEAQARGVPISTLIVEDHPVPAILSHAKDYDLVVMASHGRKGIDRVLMGSVTDKVLHNCMTPVLVVRGTVAEA